MLKSTQDPNSLKQARKDKLREKRDKEAEKLNNNKDYDPNKIEIVPQDDVSRKYAGIFKENDSDDDSEDNVKLKKSNKKKKKYTDDGSEIDENEEKEENTEIKSKNSLKYRKN